MIVYRNNNIFALKVYFQIGGSILYECFGIRFDSVPGTRGHMYENMMNQFLLSIISLGSQPFVKTVEVTSILIVHYNYESIFGNLSTSFLQYFRQAYCIEKKVRGTHTKPMCS